MSMMGYRDYQLFLTSLVDDPLISTTNRPSQLLTGICEASALRGTV